MIICRGIFMIFGTDGIRGIVNNTINTQLAYDIGRAYAKYILKHKLIKKIFVGRDTRNSGDTYASAIVNMLKGRIDNNIYEYEKKVEMSKTAGRKKKVDDRQIYDMAREGKTASQIALELGCSKATVDKNEGWKNRKIDNFIF